MIIANLHPASYYNGDRIPPNASPLLSDQKTLLIGVGRIRQQRVKTVECPNPLGTESSFGDPTKQLCVSGFKRSSQDRDSYNPLWEKGTSNNSDRFPISLTNDGWEFHPASSPKTQSLKFRGQQATYSGGGYILDLGRNRRQSISVVQYMKKTRWLDHRTRGIFIELTLMNPNLNKFVDVVILIEQGPTGSFSLTSWISPLELVPFYDLKSSDELGWITCCLIAIVVILLVWICILTIDLLNTPKGERIRKLSFWLDLLIILLAFCSLAIVITSIVYATQFADKIDAEKVDEYVSIQRVAHWNEVSRVMFSFTQALVFMKLWQLLMYTDKRFLSFALTLKLTGSYMMAFIAYLAILFCAFAYCGNALFGQDLWEFSTWSESMISLVDQVLNARFFQPFITINPILGPVFVFLYGYFVIFIGLNFVVALLDLGVHDAKQVVKQRTVWLTYSRYFQQTVLKSMVFVNTSNRQKLSDQLKLKLDDNPAMHATTVHPERWIGMKKATTTYLRSFLVACKTDTMKKMEAHCNMLLSGTGYRMVTGKQKAMEKELVKQQHMDQLRRMTADYIRQKLGHEMKPDEFREYAEINKYIVKLRIQKMEKVLERLIDKIDQFVNFKLK